MDINALLNDPHFWVLISTIVFAAVVYAKGRKPLFAMLDARTARIQADLDEAARLRAEAESLLADSQKKHRDAVTTAQKILENAKENAARYEADSRQKLQDSLARREEQLIDRISRAETAAIQQLREQAADLATKAAEVLLQDALKQRGGKLVDDAIAEIPARLA